MASNDGPIIIGRSGVPRSSLPRRRAVDGKLERGERVSVREIVEAYCELQATPNGMIPSVETIARVREKAAEASARGLLEELVEQDR